MSNLTGSNKKISDSEYKCPEKPNGFDDISNGATSYNNKYACNANFDTNIQNYRLFQMYNCKFNGIKLIFGAPFQISFSGNFGSEISILEKCEFRDCKAIMEGAIYATIKKGSFDSQFLIKECKFENNFSERGGGTMWFQGTYITIEKCIFKNNVGI